MTHDPHASKNPLANKRYAYAKTLESEGDWTGAVDLYEQALELDPDWAAAWYALGLARQEARVADAEAVSAFERALALDPADSYGAGLRLARLKGEAPAVPAVAYVRGLFDQYAETFESVLVDRLGYRAPALIAAALQRAAPGRSLGAVMDWGCGTGLMADALKGRFGAIDGLDLAPAMVAAANQKGVYRHLRVANVLDPAPPGKAYDAVIAADVLCYIGELSPVFERARDHLRPAGLFAFSVEALDPLLEDVEGEADMEGEADTALNDNWPPEGADVALLPSLRYAHGLDGLLARAAGADFALLDMSADVLRHDRGRPVIGYVMVFALEEA